MSSLLKSIYIRQHVGSGVSSKSWKIVSFSTEHRLTEVRDKDECRGVFGLEDRDIKTEKVFKIYLP